MSELAGLLSAAGRMRCANSGVDALGWLKPIGEVEKQARRIEIARGPEG